MPPEATEFANRLTASIGKLSADDLRFLQDQVAARANRKPAAEAAPPLLTGPAATD